MTALFPPTAGAPNAGTPAWFSLAHVRAVGLPYRAPVIALGTFDGVHRGHQAIVDRARTMAAARGGTPIAFTFDRHPSEVVSGRLKAPLLTGLVDKVRSLREAGAAASVVATFDATFARLEPGEFVERVLAQALGARGVVCGFDFRFGRGAAGDAAFLQARGQAFGFEVAVLEPVLLGGEKVSSTDIRRRLDLGDVEGAAALLGRPYRMVGRVIPGSKQGRELGFPTANVQIDPRRAIPADGVYYAWVRRNDRPDAAYPGLAVVSARPTFGHHPRGLEVHVLNFADDLYGQCLVVDFLRFVRGIVPFSSFQALREQIAEDVAGAQAWFARR